VKHDKNTSKRERGKREIRGKSNLLAIFKFMRFHEFRSKVSRVVFKGDGTKSCIVE